MDKQCHQVAPDRHVGDPRIATGYLCRDLDEAHQ